MDIIEADIIEKLDEMINNNVSGEALEEYFLNTRSQTNNCLSLLVLKYLLERVPIINHDHIFSQCCRDDDTDKLLYLVNNYNININNKWALINAMNENRMNVISFLIDHGLNPELHKNNIFYHVGAYPDKKHILKYFLDLGLVPKELDVYYGVNNPVIFQTYIEYGIDPIIIFGSLLKDLKNYNALYQNLIILRKHGYDLNEIVDNFL